MSSHDASTKQRSILFALFSDGRFTLLLLDLCVCMCRSVESMLRSLNNLIEKLHHSTWFYLLISNRHFVTMNKYVYAFALLGAPIPLMVSNKRSQWLFILLTACLLDIPLVRRCFVVVFVLFRASITSTAHLAFKAPLAIHCDW